MNFNVFLLFLGCLNGLFSSSNLFEEFSRLSIHSFPFLSHQRFVEIQIEGKKYLALIDTGSAFSFIRKDVIGEIVNKSYVSDSEYISVVGKKYITSNFKLPEIKIGDFIAEAIFKEEDENFWTDGSSIGKQSIIHSCKIYLMHQVYREAVVGMDLFQKFACIFDFPHSCFFLGNKMSLESRQFLINEFHAMPFEMGKAGVVVTLEIDIGIKRFLLDSAATMSIIRLSNEEIKTINDPRVESYISDCLIINDMNFGCWKFGVVDIANEFDDIDGILGIDFFKKNIIGLDFENRMAFIQPVQLGSKERFTYWLKSYFGK